LGVGGLISAYKTSAQITLEASEIIEKTIDVHFQLNFEYDLMNAVQRIIREKNLEIIHQKLELACEFVISIRKKEAQTIFDIFENLYKVEVIQLD
jgi:putative IMPACT (imprinted ancient) family translation regulator